MLVYFAYTALFFGGPSSAGGAVGVVSGVGEAIGFLGFFAIAVIGRATRYRFLERLWPRGVSWDEEDRIWAEKAAAK